MKPRNISRRDVLRLSAETELDPRTIKRAVERGVNTMKAEADRRRLREAATKLSIAIE
jgi:hypothetical protein